MIFCLSSIEPSLVSIEFSVTSPQDSIEVCVSFLQDWILNQINERIPKYPEILNDLFWCFGSC